MTNEELDRILSKGRDRLRQHREEKTKAEKRLRENLEARSARTSEFETWAVRVDERLVHHHFHSNDPEESRRRHRVSERTETGAVMHLHHLGGGCLQLNFQNRPHVTAVAKDGKKKSFDFDAPDSADMFRALGEALEWSMENFPAL